MTGDSYLQDCGVIGKTALKNGLRLWGLADADVLDVRSAEDDVLVHLVTGSYGTVRGTILGTKRTNCNGRKEGETFLKT